MFETSFTSTQQNELFAVLQALLIDVPINIITDSKYVSGLIPNLETAYIPTRQDSITHLTLETQKAIRGRFNKFHVYIFDHILIYQAP